MPIGELGSYQKSGQNNENTSMLYQSGSGVEKTITGDNRSIRRPRRAQTGSLSSIPQPSSEQIGLKTLRTEVPAPKKPSAIFVQARSETGEIVDGEKLEELLKKREEEYQKDRETITPFDFSQKPELKNVLDQAVNVAGLNIMKRRSLYELPNEEIPLLQLEYAQCNGENVYLKGMWYGSGLNVVYVEESPLLTALNAADMLTGASQDRILEYHEGQTEPVDIAGLVRSYPQTGQEGILLHEVFVSLQRAEIYEQFKRNGLFQEETAVIERGFNQAIHNPLDYRGKLSKEDFQALVRAKNCGIPQNLLEGNSSSSLEINQILFAWKLARLIGNSLITDSTQKADTHMMVDKGREVLERSKYFGTDKAHRIIREIFEPDDAELILKSDGDERSFNKIHAAIQKAEEREGLVLVNQEIREAVRAVPFEVRSAETGEKLEAETEAELLMREQKYQLQLANLHLYNESMPDEMSQAQEVIITYLLNKRYQYGLRDDGFSRSHVQYVERIGGEDEGYFEPSSGLVVVQVIKDNLLQTAKNTAHELGHASSGVIIEKNENSIESDEVLIDGFIRRSGTKEEGDLIDEGIEALLVANIYKEFKENGFFKEDTQIRESIFEVLKRDASAESAFANVHESVIFDVALSRALAHRVPDYVLEAYILDPQHMEELLVTLRVARLIGKNLVTDSTQTTDIQLMENPGIEVLERAKYLGPEEAHEHIKRIFGEDAEVILTDESHPESFEEIDSVLLKAEQRAGIALPVYPKKIKDFKRVTEIYNKTQTDSPLDASELAFLYGTEGPIYGKGFGDDYDPRIKELLSRRNPQEDIAVIFGCEPSQVAHTVLEITPDTKVYVGPVNEPGIFDRIQEYNIENAYTSFPRGKITRKVK